MAGLAASLPDSQLLHMIPSTTLQPVGSDRASMSMPIRITILSREDCHLCDVVYRIAAHLQSRLHIEINIVDVDSDSSLTKRYGTRVPVVLLDEIEYFAGSVTEEELRRAIIKRGGEDR